MLKGKLLIIRVKPKVRLEIRGGNGALEQFGFKKNESIEVNFSLNASKASVQVDTTRALIDGQCHQPYQTEIPLDELTAPYVRQLLESVMNSLWDSRL